MARVDPTVYLVLDPADGPARPAEGAGPVFTTATRPDAGEGIGLDGLAALVTLAEGTLPIVAIGGITTATDPAAVVRALPPGALPRRSPARPASGPPG
ncbi:MAG TPA: thiamine phosphate synthase [Actinomycetospora sp.]|jgi:hypothetical protein|uniref:thiamine phosphate synthase n=1 Tax=Actinomycetospora sp. TaxID=1872135 RepID=UPI002F3E20F9